MKAVRMVNGVIRRVMNRVIVKKGKVGKSVLGGYEKVSALVGYFGEIGSGGTTLAAGKYARLSAVTDMAAFGIGPEANALLFHHVSEYFRTGGKGVQLYVLNVPKVENEGFADLIGNELVKQMIAAADGNIFQVGFAYSQKSGSASVDGLPSEMVPAIKAAQAFADWTQQTNRPTHVVLECAGLSKVSAATLLNLREMMTNDVVVDCPQVSVMIGQDWDFAERLTGDERMYADVGALLGCMAAQPVSYNVGEVATMVLTDAVRGSWVNAGLSSHEKVKEKENELDGLNTKGYIFGEYYSGVVCLNDDHVCARVVTDKEGNLSESTIAMSRTNCKVMRELYGAYLPKIKSTVPLDTQTGKLGTGTVKYFEDIGNAVFENMAAKQELSGGETEVDGDSDLMAGNRVLKVFFRWVPMGCIGVIEGTVNIKSSI